MFEDGKKGRAKKINPDKVKQIATPKPDIDETQLQIVAGLPQLSTIEKSMMSRDSSTESDTNPQASTRNAHRLIMGSKLNDETNQSMIAHQSDALNE